MHEASYPGFYRAIVVDNHDPKNQGRLRLMVPQVSGENTTDWAWPILTVAIPPAAGTALWAAFEGGDPNFPLWIGTL